MNEETMVENIDNEQADDTLEENVVEEEQDESESLDSLTGDGNGGEEAPDDEPEQPAQQSATEPGWIKKRVEKAVSRAVAETEARMQAMFDQQMAPIRAKMMEDEAQALVRSRKVSDIETARELVRLRNGQPAAEQSTQSAEQPRQANGQFASKSDPATEKQIAMLKHQANKIRSAGGPDVLAEFRENEEIKQKVIKGEMDFYDVRDYMNSQKTSKKRAPSPMRSPNGASGKNPNAIDTMSDEQFDRMEKRIKEGARYTLK